MSPAGEETGRYKMIIEKKVGGPRWPLWPGGTVIWRRLEEAARGGRQLHVIFEKTIMSLWTSFDRQ